MRNALTLTFLAALACVGPLTANSNSNNGTDTVLYVWAGDQARTAPDFLAVIDFDRNSANYGKVINKVDLPPPGNVGNESHHCHLSADQKVLACGGLLSLLKGQNGIFFFDVTDKRNPQFMFSTSAVESSITDDFLPLPGGGFLITQMGSASGGSPGRVAEYDQQLHFVANHFGSFTLFQEWPTGPADNTFNPHGISARPDLNLMMTADFVVPASTLNVVPGDPVLQGSVRVWDYNARTITKTIPVLAAKDTPAAGTMDVKLLPNDPTGYGYTAGMFDGHIYAINPVDGTSTVAFDMANVTPHVDTLYSGGMPQLMVTPSSGDRLILGTFMAGQVVMLDTTDRTHLKQVAVANLGAGAGPHALQLSSNEDRLVVSDYFLNEDNFGKVHAEGDHKIHVLNLTHDGLTEDPQFQLDFNTAFPGIQARPHGMATK
jgi:56kDa selenium binding protein (SBP56)